METEASTQQGRERPRRIEEMRRCRSRASGTGKLQAVASALRRSTGRQPVTLSSSRRCRLGVSARVAKPWSQGRSPIGRFRAPAGLLSSLRIGTPHSPGWRSINAPPGRKSGFGGGGGRCVDRGTTQKYFPVLGSRQKCDLHFINLSHMYHSRLRNSREVCHAVRARCC